MGKMKNYRHHFDCLTMYFYGFKGGFNENTGD
jgi:hypothetical protein